MTDDSIALLKKMINDSIFELETLHGAFIKAGICKSDTEQLIEKCASILYLSKKEEFKNAYYKSCIRQGKSESDSKIAVENRVNLIEAFGKSFFDLMYSINPLPPYVIGAKLPQETAI